MEPLTFFSQLGTSGVVGYILYLVLREYIKRVDQFIEHAQDHDKEVVKQLKLLADRQKTPFGRIAVRLGFMTEDQVLIVLKEQDEPYGEHDVEAT